LLLCPFFNSRNLKVSFSLVPIGQVALRLDAQGDSIRVTLRTMTPNFKAYQMRLDGGPWSATGESLMWSPHPGLNRLEARTMNPFGVEGPLSTVEIER